MNFKSKKQSIQRICGSAAFSRLMFSLAIFLGGCMWAAAMMMRYLKGV